jgi:mannose-6-phosphate isomerase-like protein (cupin superfamily)
MKGYELLNIGAPSEWRDHFGGFRPESSRNGRRVVDHEMHLQYIGMTVNSLVAGEEAGYWHKHSQVEEVYIFLAGHGQLGLNNDLVDVHAGSVVRLSPETWITWRCHPDEKHQLQWICVRAGGTELPEFPDDATKDTERKMPWA